MERFDPAERRKVLGCSEIAQALGYSPWGTSEELRLVKVGRSLPEPENAAMRRGKKMERITRELYFQKTGRVLFDMEKEYKHSELPWLVCHVDALIQYNHESDLPCPSVPWSLTDKNGIFEGKAPGSQMAKAMKENGLTNDYIHQMMGMLAVTGLQWGSYALYDHDEFDVVTFDVQRDGEFIGLMLEAVTKFWWHVENDVTLDPAPLIDPASMPVVRGEKEFLTDPALVEIAAQFVEADGYYQETKKIREALVEQIRAAMQPYELAEIGGILRVSHKQGEPKQVIDADALWAWCQTSVPGFQKVADKFVTTKPGSRTLRPTPIKGTR